MTVCFRIEKDGEVLAVFPYVPQECAVLTYAHVGQHADADWWYLRNETRPAYSCEYMGLLRELKRYGYKDLRIINRLPGWHQIQTGRIMGKE